MIQIQWHDRDPDSGERRYWRAERFAGQWKFQCKTERRGPWEGEVKPTRDTWERVLENMQRRYRRRQGVDSISEVVRVKLCDESENASWNDPGSLNITLARLDDRVVRLGGDPDERGVEDVHQQ